MSGNHAAFCTCLPCQMAQQVALYGMQQAAALGQLGDRYIDRMAQGAALMLDAPGPLGGRDPEDDGQDGACAIPGCFVCEGKMG